MNRARELPVLSLLVDAQRSLDILRHMQRNMAAYLASSAAVLAAKNVARDRHHILSCLLGVNSWQRSHNAQKCELGQILGGRERNSTHKERDQERAQYRE